MAHSWNGHRPDRRTTGAQRALAADAAPPSKEAQERWSQWNAEAQARYNQSPFASVPTRIDERFILVD